MEPSPSDEGKKRIEKILGAKIPITPRKSNTTDDPAALQLHTVPEEAVWERENRIRPKEPKIPFGHPLKTVSAPGLDRMAPLLPYKSRSKHSLLRFFRSRRKGGYRIVNFLVLPIAVLLTAAVIVWLLKFL